MRRSLIASVMAIAMLCAVLPATSSVTVSYGHTWGMAGFDYAYTVDADASGNVYIAGRSNDPLTAETSAFVAKFDPSGILVWDVLLGNGDTVVAIDIAVSTIGDVYIAGSYSDLSSEGTGFYAKVTSDGALQYSKSMGMYFDTIRVVYSSETNAFAIIGHDEMWQGVVIVVNDDGSVKWSSIAEGWYEADPWGAVFDSSGNLYAFIDREIGMSVGLVAFDQTGSITAQMSFDVPFVYEYSWDVAWGADGNLYLMGCAYQEGLVLMLKLSPSLEHVWAELVGNPLLYQEQTCLVSQPDGSLYTIGVVHDVYNGTFGPSVFQFDQSGTVLGATYYPQSSTGGELQFNDAASVPGVGLVISGGSFGPVSLSGVTVSGIEITPLEDYWTTDSVTWLPLYLAPTDLALTAADPDALVDDYDFYLGFQAWYGVVDTRVPTLTAEITTRISNSDPNEFTFRGKASGGQNPYTYQWNFGDGTSDSGSRVVHTYPGPGFYSVALLVTDAEGQIGLAWTTACVAGPPVITSFNFWPNPALLNSPVTFMVEATDLDGGYISQYLWDFGDSNLELTANSSVVHSYNAAGMYYVTVAVYDDEGETASSAVVVEVLDVTGEPVAAFYWYPSVPTVGEWVMFDGLGSYDYDGYVVAYQWYFGDGGYSFGPTVSHVFYYAGTYLVTLSVVDNSGLGGYVTYSVEVLGGGAGADYYEPDDDFTMATPIMPGESQLHSIHNSGADVDWLTFWTNESSWASIYTYGWIASYHDTMLFLYDSYGVPYSYIAMDDDSGGDMYSRIEISLEPGTYYIMVRPFSTLEIAEYYITLQLGAPPNQPPVVTFTWEGTPTVGVPVLFDATGSYDPDGYIVEYYWFFVGENVTEYGPTITHTFTVAGWTWVELAVMDDDWAYSWASCEILVYMPAEPDAYEPDDTYDLASAITMGESQLRSIHDSGLDVDWAMFTLEETTSLRVRTSGPLEQWTDTMMELYDSAGVPAQPIASDDDSGGHYWSMIRTTLDPGTYYVKVWSLNMSYEIPVYYLTLELSTGLSSWTLLVYMDADNNLELPAIWDFQEMAVVGSTVDLNIVVQFDRIAGEDESYGGWTTTKRFLVELGMEPYPTSALEDIGEANMGDWLTLADFITWGTVNYPADNYALILWDHGGGWDGAVCWDDTSMGDSLTLDEVELALATALSATGARMNLVGFDACLMGMAEVSYEFWEYMDVMVASEELVAWEGFPYHTILNDLVSTPGMTAVDLGAVMVQRFIEYFGTYGWDEMSAVSMTGMAAVYSAVNVLAFELMLEMSNFSSQISEARWATEFFGWDYVDLYDFAYELSARIPEGSLRTAAEDLMLALEVAVIAEAHGDYHTQAHGVSIYYPSSVYYAAYDSLDFAADFLWDEFLQSSGSISSDIYEPDDNYSMASWITLGEVQTHSIDDGGGDVDWAVFYVDGPTDICVETFGQWNMYYDTQLWLYDSSGVPYSPIGYSDDANGTWSVILTSLPSAGYYYIEVASYLSASEIPLYYLTVSSGSYPNQPPFAGWSLDVLPVVGVPATFNGSYSWDPDGYIVDWMWDFGDGTNASGMIVEHTFTSAGVFNVTLWVTDDDGAQGSATLEIWVYAYAAPEMLENPD